MFRANIENREAPKYEKIIDGYFEFLFVNKNGNPLVANYTVRCCFEPDRKREKIDLSYSEPKVFA